MLCSLYLQTGSTSASLYQQHRLPQVLSVYLKCQYCTCLTCEHTWTSFQPTVIFHQYCKAKSKDDSRHFGIVKWFCSHYSFQKVQRFLHKVKLIQFCIHMAKLSTKPKPELPWRKVCMAVNFYQDLPILSLRLSPGLWCILKFLRALRRCSDIEAISPAWLSPFGFGRPAITHHKQHSGLHGL